MPAKHDNQRGSVVTEFVMAFMFASIGLLLVIEFNFFAIGGEIASYAAYMGSRTLKVYGDAEKVMRQIAPWIIKDGIALGVESEDGRTFATARIVTPAAPILGREAGFSILHKNLVLDVKSSMVTEPLFRQECEDNPLWDEKGDEPCVF